jgi:ABC-type nitrate/sulfonate/bicarbonate transport system ATPase subunit
VSNLMADQLATTSGAAIRAEGLRKSYRSWRGGDTTALDRCGFEVPAGAVAALIGANGTGKTTLLSVLAGLLAPDAGRLHARPRVAFVSQDKALYKHLTPVEVLALTARLNRVWDAPRARGWLERYAVPTGRACGKLSGGQRAQVAFAAALGSCPDVLLADEPLSDLDPLVRREVMADLLEQAARTGMTIVLSTHVVGSRGSWCLMLYAAVIAAFWAAPLVSREYEQGTHLLAWSQDVAPSRWLAGKATALLIPAVPGAVVLGILYRFVSAWVKGAIPRDSYGDIYPFLTRPYR